MNDFETECLFIELNKLPKQEPSYPTLHEIAGYPHYENVASNILAFFFNTEGVHNLKDLFIKSLFKCVDIPYNILATNSVEREECTDDRKRLDITIATDEFLIAIENKIFHSVQNDLVSYSTHLEGSIGYAEDSQLKLVKILLGLREVKDQFTIDKIKKSGFKQVTYEKFFDAIKSNLGYYMNSANPDYLIHLKEFIKTIENLIKSTNMDSTEFKFFEKYEEQYLELARRYDTLTYTLLQKVRELKYEIEEKESSFKIGIYKKIWAYWYSYPVQKSRVCVEAEARIKGWYLMISLRDSKYAILPQSKQESFARTINLNAQFSMRDGKMIVETFSMEKTSPKEMALKVIELIKLVENGWPSATAPLQKILENP
jgi:hypothetical protein